MSDTFTTGFAAGFLLCAVISMASDLLYKHVLRLKAHQANRTPEKIGRDFYYIVPEPEYIDLLQRVPCGEGTSDDVRHGVKLLNAHVERDKRAFDA